MTSPFILGNDFADQYSISVIQQEGGCNLEFGDSGQRMEVENSVLPPFVDEDGHAFKVQVLNATSIRSHRHIKGIRNSSIKLGSKIQIEIFNQWLKLLFPRKPRLLSRSLLISLQD